MKVHFVNLNVWLGGKLQEAMMTYLQALRPDVLVCQEVFDGKDTNLNAQFRTFSVIKEKLQFPYAAFAPAFVSHSYGLPLTQGNAVFSAFPLTACETTFYDVPFGEREKEDPALFPLTPRNLQHVALSLSEHQKLHVFNTQGIWGKDGLDSDRRSQMCQTIAQKTSEVAPTILAGDFNMFPNTQSIALIEKHLKNLIAPSVKTTFNLRQKPSTFVPNVVDMVFASPEIKVLDVRVPDIDVSDHLPVEVDLDFEGI